MSGPEPTDVPTTGPEAVARRLYAALAAGDRDALAAVLDPAFHGRTAEGLPLGLGGDHDGPDAMRRDVWGRIARHFDARAEPERYLPAGDGRLLVTGRYRGTARVSGRTLDAAFAHLLDIADGRITRLEQFTDTAHWAQAAAPPPGAARSTLELTTVTLSVADGVATLRLERPDANNALDVTMAEELSEVATRLAEDPAVRAVLLVGSGPRFTVGGDRALFARLTPEELPHQLRRMIDGYHLAIERLTAIDAPVVAAVRGAAAGGGLGLLYCADVVVAAEDATFALGYGELGLTADGGNTWYLPRLVGLRRAQELFLLGRRFTAAEALEWGLVTRLAPAEQVEEEAAAIAATLAAGPTRAFGGMRRLLRQSFETGLADQLHAEQTAIVAAAATADAAEGIAAARDRRPPCFEGR